MQVLEIRREVLDLLRVEELQGRMNSCKLGVTTHGEVKSSVTYFSDHIAPLHSSSDRLDVLTDRTLPITLLVQPVPIPTVNVSHALLGRPARLGHLESERKEGL